ncbi:MAG TPA: Crp/Fnr family transcriptional regulator [Candidatus Binatia bacterium]|jgi:CRP/FNR family cyclic AMP-dependent transcriptional regulator|nr:Crp/Fnr family transcriptional regulator [Candidatus Binatia bacterium]
MNLSTSGVALLGLKWQDFLREFPLITRTKSQILLFQGEAPRFAHVIKKGVVKTYNVSGQGIEQLIGFETELNAFPFTWIWNKAPSSLYYYEALSDCEVYCVPRDRYIDFISSDNELLTSELKRHAHNEVGHTLRLNALLNLKAKDKLIHTLHYLAQAYGRPLNGSQVQINLRLTQQDFANLVGITRETAATELNKLKKLGVIFYNPGVFYRVDLAKLSQLLNDQFIAEIKDVFN